MGVECSQQSRNAAGRHLIYEVHGNRRKNRLGDRCSKCGGHGKIYVESECNSCRCEERTTWSNYTRQCPCNGYGRQTFSEQCDDCRGRGHQ
jgi:hypothetical protein